MENQLKRTAPELEGISSSTILDLIKDIESKNLELHSFMLLRNGNIAFASWWKPYASDVPHVLYSLSKSFTSTAVGFAIQDNLLTVEDNVISFFPDDVPENISDNLRSMKVKHLLSMNTGHTNDTLEKMFKNETSFVKGFFEYDVEKQSGTHFLYNNGASYMLSAIVHKLTNVCINDYLYEKLFKSLGIELPEWDTCPNGINFGGFGLSLKTEDIAKFGQFYLNKGKWQGKQLLNEEWIDEATSYKSDNSASENTDWSAGYGYQFWMCQNNTYRGDGAFGQFCIVLPDKQCVIVFTAGHESQAVMDSIWDKLYPNIGDILPENKIAYDKLIDAALTLEYKITHISDKSPIIENINKKTYEIDENTRKVSEINFNFNDDELVMSAIINDKKHLLPINNNEKTYGNWMFGINSYSDNKLSKAVIEYTWKDDYTMAIVIRYYETPYTETITIKFDNDSLNLKSCLNVSFGDKELYCLNGKYSI